MINLSLVFLLCVICLGFSVNAQEFVPGRRSFPGITPRTDLIPDPDAHCKGNYGGFCKDCTQLLTCANKKINIQSCASIDPARPYCEDNACVASVQNQQGCNTQFKCTSAGQFPVPNDCNLYFICTAPEATPMTYDCPKGFVYDSKTGLCKAKKTAADCKTVDCSKSKNKYILFPGDKSIMIYCAETTDFTGPIMLRCPDPENMEYSLTTLTCSFACKSVGRFPDKANKKIFYECYKEGTVFKYKEYVCPDKYEYNTVSKNCEPV